MWEERPYSKPAPASRCVLCGEGKKSVICFFFFTNVSSDVPGIFLVMSLDFLTEPLDSALMILIVDNGWIIWRNPMMRFRPEVKGHAAVRIQVNNPPFDSGLRAAVSLHFFQTVTVI